METWRSWLLIFATSCPLLAAGLLIGDLEGAAAGFAINFGICLGIFGASDRIVLKATGAVPLEKKESPLLYSVTRSLATWADLTPPRLYLVDLPEPNAFLVGIRRETGAIVVTRGLLDGADPEELRGIIAHQLGHCKQGDARWSTYAAALTAIAARTFESVARSLVAPLVHLSSSRQHELTADAFSVRIAGAPDGLMKALTRAAAGAGRFHPGRRSLPLYVALPFVIPPKLNRFNPRPGPEERLHLLRRPA